MDMDHIDSETKLPAKCEGNCNDTQLFHYGVRGRKLEDPDTDDEILPAYTIRKSQMTDEENAILEESVIITEDNFEEIEDVTAEDMTEKESNE